MRVFIIPYLLFTPTFAQINYYVAQTDMGGNDVMGIAHDGSIAKPFANVAKAAGKANNPSSLVTIRVRGDTYRNSAFSTASILSITYAPQNAGEAIWKITNSEVIKYNLNTPSVFFLYSSL